MLREQRRWMEASLPATQVVYEEDRAAAVALLQSSPDYREEYFPDSRERASWGASVCRYVPPAYHFDYQSGGGLFLHGRVSRGGHERIVAVSPTVYYVCRHYREIGFTFSTGTPATRVLSSSPVFRSFLPHRLPLNGDERLRIYAGQPDPVDLSHWTMRYEINGVPGTIDGWLSDNEGIWLQVRDGPAAGRLQNPSMRHPEHYCPLPHP
jgi:hypothetical protein